MTLKIATWNLERPIISLGIFGNRNPNFLTDLQKQIDDWQRIAQTGNLCVVGDFNLSFADSYYYTRVGRHLVTECLQELNLKNLTADIPNNIDHIVISESFLKASSYKIGVWNEDKELSDHKGVWVELTF